MPLLRDDLPSRLHRKVCLACGYRGPELQGDAPGGALLCPRCGEDLYARPARSYAELEGFEGGEAGEFTRAWRRRGGPGGHEGVAGAIWAWLLRLLGRR